MSDRRKPRWRRVRRVRLARPVRVARAVGLVGALALASLLATACGTRSAAPGLGSAFARPLLDPRVAVTPGGVYVAWQVPGPGGAASSELARIAGRSGRIGALARLRGTFEQAVEAAGSLWVATSATAGQELLRLNPATLAVTGRWRTGRAGKQPWAGQVLAAAGGGLWVASAGRLARLSPSRGTVTASVIVPRAVSSDLSADGAGTVLVVGEADGEGRGAVQARDPRTGALLVSRAVTGVTAPVVAGPVASAVFLSEATGMMGYVQRLDAATLAGGNGCPEGTSTTMCVKGTNGILARVANGRLWVTQPAGGVDRNYCADPSDGHVLAAIRLPQPTGDVILAISSRRLYYAAPGPGAAQYVRQQPIPAACLPG